MLNLLIYGFVPLWSKLEKKDAGTNLVVAAPGVDNKPQPTNQHCSIIAHRVRIVQITATSMEVFLFLLLTSSVQCKSLANCTGEQILQNPSGCRLDGYSTESIAEVFQSLFQLCSLFIVSTFETLLFIENVGHCHNKVCFLVFTLAGPVWNLGESCAALPIQGTAATETQ